MKNCYDCAFGWLKVDEILNDEVVVCLNKNSEYVWGRYHDIIARPECPHWKSRSGRNVYDWIKPESIKKLHDEIFSSDPLNKLEKETIDYLELKFVENLKMWDVLLITHDESKLEGFEKGDFKEGTFDRV